MPLGIWFGRCGRRGRTCSRMWRMCYACSMEELKINRAPFLTLWAAVVARRLGYDEDEALTLGRAVAGLTAQSKGRRLGMFTPASEEAKEKVREKREQIGAGTVEMMDRVIACVKTADGIRALSKASPTDPAAVRKYLAGKFKEALPAVEEKLVSLAETFAPEDLNDAAMDVYMRLRPNVPKGREGWGQAGLLEIDKIDALIGERQAALS